MKHRGLELAKIYGEWKWKMNGGNGVGQKERIKNQKKNIDDIKWRMKKGKDKNKKGKNGKNGGGMSGGWRMEEGKWGGTKQTKMEKME
jgi:hypothetical protein